MIHRAQNGAQTVIIFCVCRVDYLLLLLFTNEVLEACFEGCYNVSRESAACQKINVTWFDAVS